jgi:hypothetical protein
VSGWLIRAEIKKKAAPLGAAVIATLNHITGHILPDLEIFKMG